MPRFSRRKEWTRRPAQWGFSYLWVLLMVALLGVGMTLVAEVYHTTLRREQEKELLFIGRQFREALRRYHESAPAGAQKLYPVSLDELLQDSRALSLQRHLRRLYKDPVTGKAEWGLLRIGGRIVGVHSLSEQEPLKKTGFEPSEQMFTNAERYSAWLFSYPADLMVKADGAELGAGSAPGDHHVK